MGTKVKISKEDSKGGKERFWMFVAIVSMTVYIVWRIVFTIPDHHIYGWLATICGIFLVVSETISMLEGAEHFIRLRKKSVPDMPVVPKSWYPDVDILIATHNEDADLLYKTINGCKYMRYPNRSKVHIFVCDDTDRPEIAELARKMGVGYFGLSENKYAKAGNLNNALSKTSSPWVVTFDADMIPTSDFLMETIPYVFLPRMKKLEDGSWVERTEEELDEDYKIGFIQTPQSFYNPDLFQYNFYSERRIPNEQDYFFREVNVSRNSANAPIYAGSNTLISRAALEEVGGIATGTITEDFETGINIQSKGYSCYAVDKALAHGLSPTDVDSLIKQRIRWGRGCVSSLRRVHLLLNPHIKLNAKFSYLSCWMYWWTFFRRFVYIASPILFVLFGIPVVICSLKELLLIWLPSYVLYNQALKEVSGKIRNKRWSNTVDTVIFPYMIIPILLETLFIKQKKFHVTNKNRTVGERSDLQMAIPHIILIGFDGLALIVAVMDAIRTQSFGGVIIIYWLAVNLMHLIMAVFFMSGRQNLRQNDRFLVKLPAELVYKEKKYYGSTGDLSETGLSVVADQPIYLPHDGAKMQVHLKSDRYETVFQATCVQVMQKDGKWKYGLKIDTLEGEDKDQYFQMLYDRDHSLAKVMGASVGMFDDIYINIHRRVQNNESSRRALSRVEVNCNLTDVNGRVFRAVNCNYEYLLLEGENLPENVELRIPETEFVMKCVQAAKKGLYRIENWEELLFADAYQKWFNTAA